MTPFDDIILEFIRIARKQNVKMIMVGGGAVNFHDYQRHSADVDFWIKCDKENFDSLIKTFQLLGYEIDSFPESVMNQLQNISIKVSPLMTLELITRFDINKSFEEAFKDSTETEVLGEGFYKYNIISYEDLITSKIKAGREKDLLDIKMLKKIKND